MSQVNSCACQFLDIFEGKLCEPNSPLLDYATQQNRLESTWPYEADTSFVQLIAKLVPHLTAANSMGLVSELMSGGRLWSYRFSQSAQLIQETLGVFKALILVKCVPIVQVSAGWDYSGQADQSSLFVCTV